MRLVMIPKPELSDAQENLVQARLCTPGVAGDKGPARVWNFYSPSVFYALFHNTNGFLVGIVHQSLRPPQPADPAWWIDPLHRSNGYWRDVVDLLAERLKAKGFVSINNPMTIDTLPENDRASREMVDRLRAHFNN